MENPSFQGSSSAFQLPNLGTTKKDSVKYVKSVDEIVAKPAVVNLENAERGQVSDKKIKPVLKKHILSKKWYKMEMGMTLVNFLILLVFFIAAMVAIHYANNGLKKDLKENMVEEFKKAMKKEIPTMIEKMLGAMQAFKDKLSE